MMTDQDERYESSNGGYSLVEAVVSIVILAIVVIPLLSSFVSASRVSAKTQSYQYANIVTENVMEEIKSGKGLWGVPYVTPTLPPGVTPGLTSTPAPGLVPTVSGEVHTYAPVTITEGTKQFDVVVSYQQKDVASYDLNDYDMPRTSMFNANDTLIMSFDLSGSGGESEVQKEDMVLRSNSEATNYNTDIQARLQDYETQKAAYTSAYANWISAGQVGVPPTAPSLSTFFTPEEQVKLVYDAGGNIQLTNLLLPTYAVDSVQAETNVIKKYTRIVTITFPVETKPDEEGNMKEYVRMALSVEYVSESGAVFAGNTYDTKDEVEINSLDEIYLLYVPWYDLIYGLDILKIDLSGISSRLPGSRAADPITGEIPKIGFYVVNQVDEATTTLENATVALPIEFQHTKNELIDGTDNLKKFFEFYSQNVLSMKSIDNYSVNLMAGAGQKLYTILGNQARIFDVTVTTYDKLTSDKVTSTTSSIYK